MNVTNANSIVSAETFINMIRPAVDVTCVTLTPAVSEKDRRFIERLSQFLNIDILYASKINSNNA